MHPTKYGILMCPLHVTAIMSCYSNLNHSLCDQCNNRDVQKWGCASENATRPVKDAIGRSRRKNHKGREATQVSSLELNALGLPIWFSDLVVD